MPVRLSLLLIVFLLSSTYTSATAGSKIEAIKGKEYTLTKQHGPWMVMAAVFSAPYEEFRTEGLTPEQAAQELVYELRTKGIPAYTYRRDQRIESVKTLDRRNQARESKYKLDTEICVLAGNYSDISGENCLAKRTLEWLKKYRPTCFSKENGGIYRETPGQPGALSGAFLSINPMLDPSEVKRNQRDPEVVRFNSHYEHSLLENPGKFTVVVASFYYGNSVTQVGGQKPDTLLGKFSSNDGRDLPAEQAWQVTRVLREQYDMEAYVFHDRKKSVVTIGSFNSKNDPGVQAILRQFTAQWKEHPQTGQPQLVSESLPLPSQQGQWLCTFDPQPKIIDVPYKN